MNKKQSNTTPRFYRTGHPKNLGFVDGYQTALSGQPKPERPQNLPAKHRDNAGAMASYNEGLREGYASGLAQRTGGQREHIKDVKPEAIETRTPSNLAKQVSDHQEIHDSGFTEGYSHGLDGRPRRFGAPVELVLLAPERIAHWRYAYEQGFAKGKADRHQMIAWREAQQVEERSQQDHRHER